MNVPVRLVLVVLELVQSVCPGKSVTSHPSIPALPFIRQLAIESINFVDLTQGIDMVYSATTLGYALSSACIPAGDVRGSF